MSATEPTHRRPVLLLGVTGMLGGAIARHLLANSGDDGSEIRGVVRPGGYGDEKAEAVSELTDAGLKTFEADLSDGETLADALDGVDTVVSALQGLGSVIVDAQTRVLRASQRAGVRRMIPSDFSVDLYRVPPGENRNFDLRRTFAALLDGTEVYATSILNGMFTDMLTMGYPLMKADEGVFEVWGDGEVTLDMTSV